MQRYALYVMGRSMGDDWTDDGSRPGRIRLKSSKGKRFTVTGDASRVHIEKA